MKRTYLMLAVIGGLLLAACGGAPTGSALLSIDDIPNGYTGPIVHDVLDTTAWLRFDTGVPTVCNVAYGPTTDYGEVASLPMMDGATLDHDLQLFGLEPDTTYHYRFTLIDEQGNAYQSEDFTFTTLSTEEAESLVDKPEGTNVATSATVIEVSSNWNGGDNDSNFGANKAIDGDMASEWSSDGDGDDAFITLDLGEETLISAIGFATRTMGDSAEIETFTATTDSGEVLGPFELSGPNALDYFEVDVTASTLRFDVESSSGGNTGAVEIEVYTP